MKTSLTRSTQYVIRTFSNYNFAEHSSEHVFFQRFKSPCNHVIETKINCVTLKTHLICLTKLVLRIFSFMTTIVLNVPATSCKLSLIVSNRPYVTQTTF